MNKYVELSLRLEICRANLATRLQMCLTTKSYDPCNFNTSLLTKVPTFMNTMLMLPRWPDGQMSHNYTKNLLRGFDDRKCIEPERKVGF